MIEPKESDDKLKVWVSTCKHQRTLQKTVRAVYPSELFIQSCLEITCLISIKLSTRLCWKNICSTFRWKSDS